MTSLLTAEWANQTTEKTSRTIQNTTHNDKRQYNTQEGERSLL